MSEKTLPRQLKIDTGKLGISLNTISRAQSCPIARAIGFVLNENNIDFSAVTVAPDGPNDSDWKANIFHNDSRKGWTSYKLSANAAHFARYADINGDKEMPRSVFILKKE